VESTPLEGDIAVSITLYFGTKRRADLDNFNKLSLNALTGAWLRLLSPKNSNLAFKAPLPMGN
jgi:hypothetical protein